MQTESGWPWIHPSEGRQSNQGSHDRLAVHQTYLEFDKSIERYEVNSPTRSGSGSDDGTPIDQKVVVSEGKAVETPFKSRVNLMHLFGSPPPAKKGEDRTDCGVSSDKEGEPSKRVNNLFGYESLL